MDMVIPESRVPVPVIGPLLGVALVSLCALAEDKVEVLTRPGSAAATPAPATKSQGGGGYRSAVTNGPVVVPVVVVGGTPYQMGWHFGRLMKGEINAFVPPVVAGFKKELGVGDAELDEVWSATAGYTDDRVEQEILGVAQGAGLPVRLLQHAHCLPLLMPYSCSSIAAWGSATADGHLYQTRNLDWSLEAGAHEFPVLLVRLPVEGRAHVTPTFAGVVGAHCGMNAAGIVLSEMGDSSLKEAPYDVHAPHFTTWFRTMLYDAGSLTEAMTIFGRQSQTKRYHFVFGDGRTEKRAVKIRTDARVQGGDRIKVWKDADASDELAPQVLSCVVYQDEGRGAFPTLSKSLGRLDGPAMVALANSIPIKGGNVMNSVFDGTGLRMWVSYAHGSEEAYQRPYVHLDLLALDGDGDGRGDLEEGAQDRDSDGKPDFLGGR
jgi:isopenicillin-N N-acyltransferase like protein